MTLNENQKLNKTIWNNFINSFNFSIKKNHLSDKEEIKELNSIKTISEELLVSNFNRNPTFRKIQKTFNGYVIFKRCKIKRISYCSWKIQININTNEVIISYNKDCQHTKQRKLKSFNSIFKLTLEVILIIIFFCVINLK